MADRVDLSAQYSVLARAGTPASTLVTWDRTVWREPRLLVPLDVQALVVTPATSAGVWADVARRLPEGPEPAAGSAAAPGTLAAAAPFTDLPPRPAGVFLHWALPDALTAGTVAQDPGTDVGPSQLGMRPVPNRWLVVRLGGGVPRRVAAWVVESDRGLTRALTQWSESASAAPGSRTPWLQPSSLTAVTGGDPAWAAVLDGVLDRFAVRDDLAGLHADDAAGSLTYLVVGWYSDPSLDPLAGPEAAQGIEALLARLRWDLDPASLARARREAEAARAAASAARKATPPRATGGDVVASLEVGAVTARLPMSGATATLVEGSVLHVAPAAWSPRQLLCHGLVHGVRPDGLGDDERPAAGEVAAALGSSVEESFAALLARTMPDPLGGERLTAAFLRGMAGRYDDPDGAVAVDEDLHGAEFVALPGGTRDRADRVRTGGLADGVLDALGTVAADRTSGVLGGRTSQVSRFGKERPASHVVERGTSVAEVFGEGREGREGADDAVGKLGKHEAGGRPGNGTRPAGPPLRGPGGFRDVEVGLPRLHVPGDPALTLVGAHRSLRHGEDGRHTASGLLACRLTGDPVDQFADVVRGADVVRPLGHGGLPPECEALVAEAALLDPFHVAETSAAAAAAAVTAGATGAQSAAAKLRVRGEVALAATATGPGSHGAGSAAVGWAATASVMDGALASPQATTWWRQPWVPMYVEWELELDLPDDDAAALRTWRLDEVDLDPLTGASTATTTRALRGRSLLTAGPAGTFGDRVRATLHAEALRSDGGELEPATEAALTLLAARADAVDVTAASLEGLRLWLLGWDDNVTRTTAGGGPAALLPSRVPRLLRSGAFRLTKARVVDTFGRVLDLGPALAAGRVAGSLTADGSGATGAAGTFVPRLTPPARLLLRLVDPGAEGVEAHVDQESGGASPVAGWLLPDPVDHAVELADASGVPLGQLLHDPDGPGVLWESAPGRPGPLGAPPPTTGPGDAPLAGVVVGLLRADADRRAAGPVVETEDLLEEEESPLSALLRVLDTTAATVDATASGSDHLAALAGRPLALIRALLRVEVGPDPAPASTPEPLRSERAQALAALARLQVPVRLGALTRLDDGLLGFWVDDDYSRFHPVDGAVLEAALDSGPRRGLLATGSSSTDPGTRPVTSPYVVADPVLRVHPGQTVRLTLVVVPGTAVNATCGLLPRTAVRLQREWVAQALERIAPSFRIGPVLVDPSTVRLPAPGGGGISPSWAHRDTPTTWADAELGPSTSQARLPERPAQVQEGWLRLVRGETDVPAREGTTP